MQVEKELIGRGTIPAEHLYSNDPPYYDGDSSYPLEELLADEVRDRKRRWIVAGVGLAVAVLLSAWFI